MGARVKDPSTGQFKEIYVKALDSMPVGTIVDYDGQASDIPTGWETYGTGQIKKTSETRPLASHTVNAYSESESNAYSCDYSNKAFGGTILWTNPNPNSTMANNTTITLNSSNYDMYEVIYKFDYTSGSINYSSTKSIKGKGALLNIYSGYDSRGAIRNLKYTNDTTLTAEQSFYNSQSGSPNYCIPLYIIGYKTGLFS